MVLEIRMDKESSRGIGMRLLAPRLNNRNLIFSAPLNQHWPRPRPLLENQPWEEHCSETLLRSSPILQTPADYKLLHIHTHTHIYAFTSPPPIPRLRRFEPPAWQAGLWPAPGNGCRSGWLLAGAGLLPLLQSRVFMVYYVLCCWGVFPVLTLYSPRSIVWGLFFFSSPSSCYAVFFFNSLSTPLSYMYVVYGQVDG